MIKQIMPTIPAVIRLITVSNRNEFGILVKWKGDPTIAIWKAMKRVRLEVRLTVFNAAKQKISFA